MPEKRERESQETWAKRVERWKDSGLTCGEFCAEIDVNPGTLMYWAWKLRKEGKVALGRRRAAAKGERRTESRVSPPTPKRQRGAQGAPPPTFVELVPSPTAPEPVEVVVRSVTVRVPQTAAADLVRRAFEFAEKQK